MVAADDQAGLVAEETEQGFGQTGVAVEEDAAVPGAGDVEEDGREAVDGDQNRGAPGGAAEVEVVADLGVVGAEISSARAAASVAARFALPGTSVRSERVTIESADERGRLQSITRRE